MSNMKASHCKLNTYRNLTVSRLPEIVARLIHGPTRQSQQGPRGGGKVARAFSKWTQRIFCTSPRGASHV